MSKKYRIVFMGTPTFAVPTLEALIRQQNLQVVAVVTSPDKPGGRGRTQLIESEVKRSAITHDIKILQPPNLKATSFVKAFTDLEPDLAVVVAFRMLPEVIWSIPTYGTINLHASLLPHYRGAAPINWAIIHGDTETGLTTFKIGKEIDTGGVIFQQAVTIEPHDDAGMLHDKMMLLGAPLVIKTVKAILTGEAIYHTQDESQATIAPKIFTENCEINCHVPAREVHNFIRGLSPYPGAWLKIDGQTVKIFKASLQEVKHDVAPGILFSDGKSDLILFASDGYLKIEELQLEGKKRMDVRSFLNGYDVSKSKQIFLQVR